LRWLSVDFGIQFDNLLASRPECDKRVICILDGLGIRSCKLSDALAEMVDDTYGSISGR